MWMLTNGIDGGITKIIGDAIREERQRRKVPATKVELKFIGSQEPEPLPKLTVIGIIPKSMLSYSSILDDNVSIISIYLLQSDSLLYKMIGKMCWFYREIIMVFKLVSNSDFVEV